MSVDTRQIAEAAVGGKLDISAREVLVAAEIVELQRAELEAAEKKLNEATNNFDQERILCFLSEMARQHRSWCSLHHYFERGHFRGDYYSARYGELTDSPVEISLIWVWKNCYHRGDHFGSDSEWTEEHVHAVCPDCLEAARDHIGNSDLAMVHRAEKRDDGYYHKNGNTWVRVADDAKYFLAPEELKPEWEVEFGIPPSLSGR